MKVTEVFRIPPAPNPHRVDIRKIYDSPHASAVIITLKPGEALRRHSTPVDVFFYVIEGTGMVEIGDEKEIVGRDMVIESPATIPHRLINESDAPFRVLVVKAPRQEGETRLL